MKLADFWESYRALMVPKANEQGREILRKTFYTGAQAAYLLLMGSAVRDSPEVLRANMDSLHDELSAFKDSLLKPRGPIQ